MRYCSFSSSEDPLGKTLKPTLINVLAPVEQVQSDYHSVRSTTSKNAVAVSWVGIKRAVYVMTATTIAKMVW